MNKKIKIIGLLNKIANGEEVPRHIKYECYQYDWRDNANDYICEDADGKRLSMFDDGYICILCDSLNDEVEILEDNTKKIEEIDEDEARHEIFTYTGEGERRSNLYCFSLYTERYIVPKINELVKAVNKMMKEGKE